MTSRHRTEATSWGDRASSLYEPDYARLYRSHDDELHGVAPFEFLSAWIRSVSASTIS